MYNDTSMYRRIMASLGHYTSSFFFHLSRWTFRFFFMVQAYFYPAVEDSVWDSYVPLLLTDIGTNSLYEWPSTPQNSYGGIWYEEVGLLGSVIEYKSKKTGFHYKVPLRKGEFPIDTCIMLQQSKKNFLNTQKHILFATATETSTRECFDVVDELNEFAGPNGTFVFNGENYVKDVLAYTKRKYNIYEGEISWMNNKGEEYHVSV